VKHNLKRSHLKQLDHTRVRVNGVVVSKLTNMFTLTYVEALVVRQHHMFCYAF
jgi:hypothetical protein